MFKIVVPLNKPKNFVAKDLRSSKYRLRVAKSKKVFDRAAQKSMLRKEFYA